MAAMDHTVVSSNAVKDSILAGLLMASPAWVPWLSSLNEILTTITLLCGALLGMGRLWMFVKRRRNERRS